MSLVDYASSSDDDVSDTESEPHQTRVTAREEASCRPPPTTVARNNENPLSSSTQQEAAFKLPAPAAIEKLPDASLLLNSPSVPLVSGNDHASHVAAAMAQSASRKREPAGNPPSVSRSKLQRGNLPHSKSIPETIGGVLLPPQLKGRSNVATEDISKLFVNKHPDHNKVTASANQIS